jgi:hypothetical protein
VDAVSKVIEDYTVTDAAVHDSQEIGNLMAEGDGFVFADSPPPKGRQQDQKQCPRTR